jgi:histolysain
MFDNPKAGVPQEKNWLAEGFVSIPEDQLQCGSCWAASTAATLESLALISGSQQSLSELSVQQLVDCDEKNNGCISGWTFNAWDYTSRAGLMLRSDYLYSGVEGKCQYDASKTSFKNNGMKQERLVSNEHLKQLVAK